MKIGIAGPVSLEFLRPWLSAEQPLPEVYSFPLIGRIAAALLTRGHSVSVFAGSDQVSSKHHVSGNGVDITVCPRRSRRIAYDFYAVERSFLSSAIRNSGCDLIHAHWCYEFAAAAQESGLPALITAHDCPNEIARCFRWTSAFPHWFCRSLLGRRVCRNARFMTCVSPYVEKSLRHLLGPKTYLTVIPNGVPAQLFGLGKTRLSQPPPHGPFRVATVLEGFGTLKNARSALQAFPLFLSHCPTAELWMFGGDFQPQGPAATWARHHGLDKQVVFCGRTPQTKLHRLLQEEISVLLHPSLSEAHPMALLECMALGIPVIGGESSGGVPYTLDFGRAGLLTDITAPHLMAAALVKMYMDESLRKELANHGWRRAHQLFHEDRMMDQYFAEYMKVLSLKGIPQG